MTDRYETEEWTDKDGNPFTVHRAVEDHSTYVNGGYADVKEGDRLLYSGSDSVGYYTFDADAYKSDGATPPSDETEPESSETESEPTVVQQDPGGDESGVPPVNRGV